MSFNIRLAGCVAGALLFGASSAGAITFTVSSSVGGAPTGVSYLNFDSLPLGAAGGVVIPTGAPAGGVTVSFSPDGATVQGAAFGLYAAPFLSNNNGVLFGDPENTADTTRYLTSGGVNGVSFAKLVFTGAEQYVGLLWGSVDTFNTLSFYSGNLLLGSVTGTDVTAGANGDQGVNGTRYVNINSDTPFDTIIATSSVHAFEFDNVAFNPTPTNQGETPLPAAVVLFGTVIAGSGLLMRRRNRGASRPA